MSNTNWVTIKIPEPTRDEAKADPRTYEEIMQAGLKADAEETEVVLGEGYGEIADRIADGIERDDSGVSNADLLERMDELGESVREATNAAQSTERTVEELQR